VTAIWVQWAVALAIVAAIPWLIRWGRRHARGGMGGVAMMLGLAFGHVFDPARAEATETLARRREAGKQEAEAGEGPPAA
jgi:hypothetical protein